MVGPGGRPSRDALAAAGVALLGGLFLWELVLMVGVPVARDMQLFFIPQKHLLWEALQAGKLPLWATSTHCFASGSMRKMLTSK